jgi:hypothetical protein
MKLALLICRLAILVLCGSCVSCSSSSSFVDMSKARNLSGADAMSFGF